MDNIQFNHYFGKLMHQKVELHDHFISFKIIQESEAATEVQNKEPEQLEPNFKEVACQSRVTGEIVKKRKIVHAQRKPIRNTHQLDFRNFPFP